MRPRSVPGPRTAYAIQNRYMSLEPLVLNFHEGSLSEILVHYLFSGWEAIAPVRRSSVRVCFTARLPMTGSGR